MFFRRIDKIERIRISKNFSSVILLIVVMHLGKYK